MTKKNKILIFLFAIVLFVVSYFISNPATLKLISSKFVNKSTKSIKHKPKVITKKYLNMAFNLKPSNLEALSNMNIRPLTNLSSVKPSKSPLNEADIMTKVYKSNDVDESSDSYEDKSLLENPIENDVLDKNDLIYRNDAKPHIKLKFDNEKASSEASNDFYILPWFIFTVFIILLILMFKYIGKLKI